MFGRSSFLQNLLWNTSRTGELGAMPPTRTTFRQNMVLNTALSWHTRRQRLQLCPTWAWTCDLQVYVRTTVQTDKSAVNFLRSIKLYARTLTVYGSARTHPEILAISCTFLRAIEIFVHERNQSNSRRFEPKRAVQHAATAAKSVLD